MELDKRLFRAEGRSEVFDLGFQVGDFCGKDFEVVFVGFLLGFLLLG